MKRMLVSLFVLCLVVGGLFAGHWEFDGCPVVGRDIATDEGMDAVNCDGLRNPYGVAVDPDGNIWFAGYYQRYYYDTDGVTQIWPDDITVHTDTGDVVLGTYPLFVLNIEDGTIDRLQFLEWVDGVTIDTTWAGCRGMVADANGDIVHCCSNGDIFHIDYETRKVIHKYTLAGNESPARPGADASGYVYIPRLLGGNPIEIVDIEDFSIMGTVTDNQPASVTRAITVSPDGNDVYVGAGGVLHYHSDVGPFGTYSLVDSIRWDPNSYSNVVPTWEPHRNLLWFASPEDAAVQEFVALDPNNGYEIVDSTIFDLGQDATGADTTTGGYTQPNFIRCIRDMDFSPDGKTMYAADFYGYTIKAWKYVEDEAVDKEDDIPVAAKFTLKQNYPNPFNPLTVIPFDIETKSFVKLTIYDISGHEIGVIVNQELPPNHYEIPFEASGLASGTYIYRLEVDGKQVSRKMLYLK